MIISNHILQDPEVVKLACTKNKKKFKKNYPDSIILHYTAGNSVEGSARYLSQKKTEASAHIVIGRGGEIYQIVPFDTIAWHAGKSEHNNRTCYNNFSIGIELDNAGYLTYQNDVYKTAFGKTIPTSEVVKSKHPNDQKERYWHSYTSIQIQTCKRICELLSKTYNIREILGHYEISLSKKLDPGPAFPLEDFRATLLDNIEYLTTQLDKTEKGIQHRELSKIQSNTDNEFVKTTHFLRTENQHKDSKEMEELSKTDVPFTGLINKELINPNYTINFNRET